jgi:hypothetical protein
MGKGKVVQLPVTAGYGSGAQAMDDRADIREGQPAALAQRRAEGRRDARMVEVRSVALLPGSCAAAILAPPHRVLPSRASKP